nr:uncharacterized protein LOC129268658 [Lytechinus pictus]
MEMPVIMSNVFDDVMDKWIEQHSKFIVLQKAILDSQEESRQKTKTLQSIAKLMSVVGPQKQDALLDSIQGIWNGSQKKISDLQHDLSKQKEQIQRSQEQLQFLMVMLELFRWLKGKKGVLPKCIIYNRCIRV